MPKRLTAAIQLSGRKKRRYDPDRELVRCSCGCGKDISRRQVRRHLCQRGVADSSDADANVADLDVDDVDIDAGGAGAGPAVNTNDIDPAGDRDADAGVDQAYADDHEWDWPLWSDPAVVQQFTVSVGGVTFGAMVTLMLALQVQLHLSSNASLTFCEAMLCTSITVLPLLTLRKKFKLMCTPDAQMVQFCPKLECVAFVDDLFETRCCPKCGADRYVAGGRDKPLHVPPPPPPHTHTPHHPRPPRARTAWTLTVRAAM
jgi:hypothetical protein